MADMGADLAAMWRRVYATAEQIARAEIVRTFGQAWRGGKFDATYLSNRVPFLSSLQQHGNTIAAPVTVGTSADSASGTVTFPIAYPSMLLAANAAAGASTLRVAAASTIYLGTALQVRQVGGSHLGETVSVTAIDTTTTPHTLTLGGTLTNSYSTSDVLAIIPDVELTSRDPAFTVALDPTHAWTSRPNNDVIETAFAYVVTRLQSLKGVSTYLTTVTIGAGASSANQVVSFNSDLGYLLSGVPNVVVASLDPDYTATIQAATTNGAGFRVVVTYTPATGAGTIGKHVSGIAIVNATTGITATDSHGAHHHTSAAPGAATSDDDAHAHSITVGVTDNGHIHSITEPNASAGHDHNFAGTTPLSPGASVRVQYMVYGTKVAAAVSNVSIRWTSAG